jgi:Peptidogalycan biosysnthesis/recognition
MDRLGPHDGMTGLAPHGSVDVLTRAEVTACLSWAGAFAHERKDRRYYEIVEDTIRKGFEYWYFAIKDQSGHVRAIQPFFILDQDILVGVSPRIGTLTAAIRRLFPRFMLVRTLMVGCTAGEGHLDGADDATRQFHARVLASAIVDHARKMKVSLVVLKEFPAKYRDLLQCFVQSGFTRVPSLPMTKLNIDYPNFDEYMTRALNSSTRAKLRKKFKAAAQASPIEMSVIDDIAPLIDDVYPLYLAVYQRSSLKFEKLTKEYFCELGRLMPDKVRFFIWRQDDKIVAFTLCMIEDDALFAEYIGFDYSVAIRLHLYHYAVRDMITWAIARGYKWFRSGGLNYDPKLHLRHRLDPVDLYVRHTSGFLNPALKRVLPLMEPTRYDKTLQKFSNYKELWARS